MILNLPVISYVMTKIYYLTLHPTKNYDYDVAHCFCVFLYSKKDTILFLLHDISKHSIR